MRKVRGTFLKKRGAGGEVNDFALPAMNIFSAGDSKAQDSASGGLV